MNSSSAFLSLKHVAIVYQAKQIVHDISFELAQGQIACLLGASGSGKTSLLRAIAGFEPVSAGEIVLKGECLSRANYTKPPEQRRVAMIFQEHALFPHLSVADNIGFGLFKYSKQERQQRVDEWLHRIGLKNWRHTKPYQLSGGQQQRVALARALAPQPDLVLMDEPFSSLDESLRAQLASDLRAWFRSQNTTVVMVTHDQHEAFSMSDCLGVLHHGTLQQWAAPHELYRNPSNVDVAHFVGGGVVISLSASATHPLVLALHSRLTAQHPKASAVLIRPDHVQLNNSHTSTIENDLTNRLNVEATASHLAFRGTHTLYDLDCVHHQEHLKLQLIVANDQAPLTIGSTVQATLDLSKLIVF